MQTEKERIVDLVNAQPDDASFDEIIRELAFARMIDRGLEDVRTGRLVPDHEMARRIRSWQE